MATQKQRQAARKNVKKAQAGARKKKTITKLSSKTRSAPRSRGRQGCGEARSVQGHRERCGRDDRDRATARGGAAGYRGTLEDGQGPADSGGGPEAPVTLLTSSRLQSAARTTLGFCLGSGPRQYRTGPRLYQERRPRNGGREAIIEWPGPVAQWVEQRTHNRRPESGESGLMEPIARCWARTGIPFAHARSIRIWADKRLVCPIAQAGDVSALK